MSKTRINKVRSLLAKNKIDSLLITNPTNIFYVIGFRGLSDKEREALLIIEKERTTLIVSRLYENEAKILSNLLHLSLIVSNNKDHIFTDCKNLFHNKITIGIESEDLKLSEYDYLSTNLLCKLSKTTSLIEEIRIQKDYKEIGLIKKAVEITDKGFFLIKNEIKAGLTELQVSKKITEIFEKLGADGNSFLPIIASGVNSANPHHVTSDKIITNGILLIDAGAKFKNYLADLTRTYYIGKPSEKFVKNYFNVLHSQEKALERLKIGISEETPWKIAYKALGNKRKYFTHGLGHGVGLDIHEKPFLRKNKHNKLMHRSVFTVEPGIYYPGWGGIRIEDYVLLNRNGPIVLSKTPKKLEEIIIN